MPRVAGLSCVTGVTVTQENLRSGQGPWLGRGLATDNRSVVGDWARGAAHGRRPFDCAQGWPAAGEWRC